MVAIGCIGEININYVLLDAIGYLGISGASIMYQILFSHIAYLICCQAHCSQGRLSYTQKELNNHNLFLRAATM